MDTRIYLVTGNGKQHLVRAPNKAQAVRHVAKAYKVEVPSQDELLAAASAGIKVEDASHDD
jgi:hypothetical protein